MIENRYALLICALAYAGQADIAEAGSQILWDTTISTVAVNGGTDSTNSGTTCIQVTSTASTACINGFIAIQNNNKQLIASALLNKTIAGKVNLYYEDAVGWHHCPGFVFTPCSVISIQSK